MNRNTVLIIDDDREMLDLMKRQLETLYDVHVSESGERAIELLSEGIVSPSLILLDIRMTGMDGYEILHLLKSDEEWRKIPVVFLTGMTDEQSECRGLSTDAVDYLKKPVSGKVLLTRVQHYIDLYSSQVERGRLNMELLESLPRALTGRETDVARLLAEFRSDREICDILHISMPYVKKLVSEVKAKLGLNKRGDIRRYLK
ncbi:MAG: response regulator [Lachnospiraceae bacterium]|nr:response regulator [Lachnospiraceae bacterium]